jgi:hypothetical protein
MLALGLAVRVTADTIAREIGLATRIVTRAATPGVAGNTA